MLWCHAVQSSCGILQSAWSSSHFSQRHCCRSPQGLLNRLGQYAAGHICSCIIVTCGMQVPGAEVKVYRVSDPVHGDNPDHFEEGVLDAPLVTDKVSSP